MQISKYVEKINIMRRPRIKKEYDEALKLAEAKRGCIWICRDI